MNCNKCISDKSLCVECKDNPIYAKVPKQSHYSEYARVCPSGYQDCVYDPGYIKYYHPKWYKSLYGDKTPEQAVKSNGCSKECDHYDDEDK